MRSALIVGFGSALVAATPTYAGTDTAFAPDVYPIQLQWRRFAHQCVLGRTSACGKADTAAAKMRAKGCEMLSAEGVRLDDNSWLSH
jgi:hypothetical protein